MDCVFRMTSTISKSTVLTALALSRYCAYVLPASWGTEAKGLVPIVGFDALDKEISGEGPFAA